MANAWREHVKKTMVKMKAEAKGETVMLKDVLKEAGKTYKKSGDAGVKHHKTAKRKTAKRKSSKKKSSKKKTAKRKSAKRKSHKKKH
jgi:topoisomerase IA-like protein